MRRDLGEGGSLQRSREAPPCWGRRWGAHDSALQVICLLNRLQGLRARHDWCLCEPKGIAGRYMVAAEPVAEGCGLQMADIQPRRDTAVHS